MKLSIIFPAYNEEKRLLPVLKEYYSFFYSKLNNDFELIVIPNNSTDKTFEIARDFSLGKTNILVKNISHYVGKGGAVMKGFELAKGDYIGFVDADESTSPEEFFKLYSNIGQNHGIIGSRRVAGAIVEPKRKFSKRVGSFGFYFVSKILFGWSYKDTQCGAKIFRNDVAKYFPEKIVEKGWIFDIDLLYLCKKNNWEIKEFPIRWVDDEGSHISNLDGVISVLKLIRYKFN